MPSTSIDLQVYHLAAVARGKLLHEASRADYNLHQLIQHATLLDKLLDDMKVLELDSDEDQEDQDQPAPAPGSSSAEGYGGDDGSKNILPEVVLYHAMLHGSTKQVVLMDGKGEDATDEEKHGPSHPSIELHHTAPTT